MVGLAPSSLDQEPSPEVVDLDALMLKNPDADLYGGYQALVGAGRTDFVWQGKPFKAGQEPQGFAPQPTPIQGPEAVAPPQEPAPEPLLTIPLNQEVTGAAPVTGGTTKRPANATEYWTETLDRSVDEKARMRVYESFVDDNIQGWNNTMSEPGMQALAALTRPDHKMLKEDWDAIDALPDDERKAVGREHKKYLKFMDERYNNVAPGWGGAHLGMSVDDRHDAMSGWLMRPPGDRFVEEVVEGWLLPTLGPESQGRWAQAVTARDQALTMELMSRVGTSLDQTVASQAYSQITALQGSVEQGRDLDPTGGQADMTAEAEWMTLMYYQLKNATASGDVAVADLPGLAVVTEVPSVSGQGKINRLRKKVERMQSAIARDRAAGRTPKYLKYRSEEAILEAIAEIEGEIQAVSRKHGAGRDYITFDQMAEESKAILMEKIRSDYGKDAADMIMDSVEMEEEVFKNSLELFKMFDPDVFDQLGSVKDDVRVRDLQQMMGLAADGEIQGPDELRGRVDVASWFFDSLMYLNRKVATGITWAAGDAAPYAYILPDGTVWKDPIALVQYVESKYKANPDKYIWMESKDLASSPGEMFWDSGGREPLKPTTIPADMGVMLDSKEAARRVEGRTIHEALFNTMSKGMAPDDKFGRGLAVTGSVSGGLLGDPLMYVGAGVSTAGKSVLRYRKLVKDLGAAGVEIGEAAAKAGVSTIDDIVAEVNGISAKEAKRLAHKEIPRYADGTPLSNAAIPKQKLLQRMYGGVESDLSESAAQSIMSGAKSDPAYFDKLADVLASDEVFRLQNHRFWTAAGLEGTVDDSANVLRSMIPTFEKIVMGTDDIKFLEKMQGAYRALATGNVEARWERAKGIYIGRYIGTPLLTDPLRGVMGKALNRGKQIVEATEKIMPGFTQPWLRRARDFAEDISQARLRLRAGVRFDTVHNADLGAQTMDHVTTEALRNASRGMAYNQAKAEEMMIAWTHDSKLKVLDDSFYDEVLPILEGGGDLGDAAMSEVIMMRRVQKAIADGRISPETEHHTIGKMLETMRESIGADEIEAMRKRWEPHLDRIEGARGVGEYMVNTQKEKGLALFLADENYATHMLRPQKTVGTKPGHYFSRSGMITEEGAAKLKDRLSRHNVERTGPPTIVEALAFGFRPVLDSRTAMLGRLRAFLDDMVHAEALTTIAHQQGKMLPSGSASLQAILGDTYNIPGLSGEAAAKRFLRESQSKADAMLEGYKGVNKKLRNIRQQQAKLAKALERRGLTSEDLVGGNLSASAVDVPEYVFKRAGGTKDLSGRKWYHGTRAKGLAPDSIDPNMTEIDGLFGQGFYMTDNPSVAGGYARRGKVGEPTVYSIDIDVSKVMDLEKPLHKDFMAAIDDAFGNSLRDEGYWDDVVAASKKPGATGEDVYSALASAVRDWSYEAGISKAELSEWFWGFGENLSKKGWEGLQHTGGKRVGKGKLHNVLILIDPGDTYAIGSKRPIKSMVEGQPASKAVPPDVAELNLLHDEIEASILAHKEAVKDFGTEYALNAEYQARLLEHTTVGSQEARWRLDNLRRKRKAMAAGSQEAKALDAEIRQLEPIREEYLRAYGKLRDAGMSDGDISGIVYELYGQPSLWHLTPAEMTAFADKGMVRLGPTLDAAQEGGAVFLRDISEATRKYKEGGRAKREIFVEWTPNDVQEVYRSLKDVFLPIETVLALKSYGYQLGKNELAAEAAMLGVAGIWMDRANRFFKGTVTVNQPSLFFGRRNQFDAMSKKFYFTGMQAFSPTLRKELRGLRNGTLDYMMTGTGQKLSAKQFMDEAGSLFQTFEQRMGVESALAPQAGATAAEVGKAEAKVTGRVKKALGRAAHAQAPGKLGVSMRPGSTGGRPPRIGEEILPIGKQASEVFDNDAKMWAYFMSRKAGRSGQASRGAALDVGRDYTNRTSFEKWFVDRMPIIFYNFHKQNLKSIKTLLEQGNFGRMAIPEKLINMFEADMPDDMRPEWMDKMTAIMGADAVWGLNRDLAGVGVLDPYATLINGIAKRRGWVSAKQAAKDFVDNGTPYFKYAMQPVIENMMNMPEGRRSKMRLPNDVQAKIFNSVGNTENPFFTSKSVGGRAKVEPSRLMEVVAGLSGLGIIANTISRHWDASKSGNPWDMAIHYGGLAKKYPYKNVSMENVRDVQEFFGEVAESMFSIDKSAGGTLSPEADLPPEVLEAVHIILGTKGMLDQVVHGLFQKMRQLQPSTPMPILPGEPK